MKNLRLQVLFMLVAMSLLGGCSTAERTAVEAGWDSSFVLTRTGRLLVTGNNANGQLGIPGREFRVFTEVTPKREWKTISAGRTKSLAIDKNERLLWTQAGVVIGPGGIKRQTSQWMNVPGSQEVGWVAIAAGGEHYLAIDKLGRLYGWGNNTYGQVGIGRASQQVSTPTLISIPGINGSNNDLTNNTWVGVWAGELHSIALNKNGMLYGWGDNRQLQVGSGGDTSQFESPIPIGPREPQLRLVWNPKLITVGNFHNLAVTQDGRLFIWGSNGDSRLCVFPGNTEPYDKTNLPFLEFPQSVAGARHQYKTISAGERFTVLLDEHLSFKVCGDNTYLQRAIDGTHLTVQGIEKFLVSAGSSHGLFWIDAPDSPNFPDCREWLDAWGADNHGQLGNDSPTTSTSTFIQPLGTAGMCQ